MAYAQTSYPQTQGINGRYTIHDIGCFLTAFANLELDYGLNISPLDINNILRDRGLFVDVDDGIRDDVDWNFVNYIDGNTKVVRRGSGDWPNSNQAIVKFRYTSPNTHQITTHFCKVQDWSGQTILDSWDGHVKHISSTVYGQPVEWAVYEHVQPAPPAPQAPLYTVQPIDPKQVSINPGAHKWNLAHGNFTDVANNPITTAQSGEVFIARAILHHREIPQYNYYLEDPNTPHGWNVLDCTDYTPPPPPYVPPAPPARAPLAEKYSLVTTLIYFGTADQAKRRENAVSTIDKGEYYLVGRDEQAVKLSKDNKADIGWINTFDNKVEEPKPVTLPIDPPPAPVYEPVDAPQPIPTVPVSISDITTSKPKPQYNWINNHEPTLMVSTNSIPITVHDLEGKYPDQQLPPNWRGEFSMYTNINGVTYYLPDKMRKSGWFFGVPETMLKPVEQARLDLNADGRVNVSDVIGIGDFILTESRRAYTKLIAPVITDLRTEKALVAKQRITKAIDGFSAARKKKS